MAKKYSRRSAGLSASVDNSLVHHHSRLRLRPGQEHLQIQSGKKRKLMSRKTGSEKRYETGIANTVT